MKINENEQCYFELKLGLKKRAMPQPDNDVTFINNNGRYQSAVKAALPASLEECSQIFKNFITIIII